MPQLPRSGARAGGAPITSVRQRPVELCDAGEEREACARIADEVFYELAHLDDQTSSGWADAAQDIAAAIRARGEQGADGAQEAG